MGTHDPGPWIATRGRASLRYFVETEPEGDCTIAIVSVSESAEANARVMAAAPELLAGLRLVRGLIAEAAMVGFNCNDGDWAERLFASQAVTHAAVAKAEGSEKPDMQTTEEP